MRGPLAALLWACFLGSSWTWVIGMLFPILLVRDYGLWGWVVFAIPNVLGATAMGFVIATPEHSRALVEKHREAALRFSEITIVYHVFVVGAWYQLMFGNWAILATAAVLILVFIAAGQRRALLASAVIVTLISLAIFVFWCAQQGVALHLPAQPRLAVTDLLLFACASLVGFALCPYLDLTFHRARQHTDAPTGQLAFALGFGVVFLLMIVFSLWYAQTLRVMTINTTALPQGVILALGAHLTIQAGFTIALHLREVAQRRGHAGLHRVFVLAIAAGALAWWALSEPFTTYYDLTIGEVVYRVFLLFYGLAFPAYVFLCMIPTRRPVARNLRLIVFAIALLAAVPMGYAGFVAGHSWWIAGALGALAAGRGVIDLWSMRANHGRTAD